jgi:hypothetical protein
MDDERDEFKITSVTSGGVSRAVPIATFLVGLFLGAAIVKPWDLIFPPQAPPAVASGPTASTGAGPGQPSPSPAPSPTSGVPADCAFAGGWRVFAIGESDPLGGDGSSGGPGSSVVPSGRRDIENPLRRWIEVDPLQSAPGPADPRIPFVTIVSERVGGIGYCPPPNGIDGPPAGVEFDAWTLDPAGTPTPLALRHATLPTPSITDVAVFVGDGPTVDGNASWPEGRYVFAIESPTPASYSRWFGVDIRTPPGHPLN